MICSLDQDSGVLAAAEGSDAGAEEDDPGTLGAVVEAIGGSVELSETGAPEVETTLEDGVYVLLDEGTA